MIWTDRNRYLRHDGRSDEQACEHAFKALTSSPRALIISSMISGGALERDAMDCRGGREKRQG